MEKFYVPWKRIIYTLIFLIDELKINHKLKQYFHLHNDCTLNEREYRKGI